MFTTTPKINFPIVVANGPNTGQKLEQIKVSGPSSNVFDLLQKINSTAEYPKTVFDFIEDVHDFLKEKDEPELTEKLKDLARKLENKLKSKVENDLSGDVDGDTDVPGTTNGFASEEGAAEALDGVDEAAGEAVGEAAAEGAEIGLVDAACDALGPIGAIAGAVISFGIAIGFGIKDLIDKIESANTTTLMFVNSIPNSSLKITSCVKDRGEWQDNYSNERICGVTAAVVGDFASAIVLNSQPSVKKTDSQIVFSDPSVGSSSTGKITAELTLANGDVKNCGFLWDNPIGPNQKRSRYEAHYLVKNSFSQYYESDDEDYTINLSLSSKDGHTRHDVIMFIIAPTSKMLFES